MSDNNEQQAPVDENKLIAERRQKLASIREADGAAFPNDFRRNVMAGELQAEYGDKEKEEIAELNIRVSVAGRMMLKRVMGKASFATVQDMSGRIQFYVARDDLPEGVYNEQFKKWDTGDIIGGEGTLMKTNKGELSVKLDSIRLLTKSLRPLPEKFKGVTDQETRYRQRYLDLIMNEESRNTFIMRSKIVAHIREFLTKKRFLGS